MERGKLIGLVIAVAAAVLLAIIGKTGTEKAKKQNPDVVRPTIVISPEIVTKDGYTPPVNIPTAAPETTAPPEPEIFETSPPTETGSKSKLDELWERTEK